jgi:hypothetical protein
MDTIIILLFFAINFAMLTVAMKSAMDAGTPPVLDLYNDVRVFWILSNFWVAFGLWFLSD